MTSAQPGSSKSNQRPTLRALIEAGAVKSGDAIYIETIGPRVTNKVWSKHHWGIIQLGSGLSTIFIRHTPDDPKQIAILLADIKNYALFTLAALSNLERFSGFRR